MKKIFIFAAIGSASLLSAAPNELSAPPIENNQSIENSSQKDQSIEKQISTLLTSDLFSRFNIVSFEVSEGNVILTGSVDKAATKQKIEEKVKAIPGVAGVDNQLKIIQKETSYNAPRAPVAENDQYINKLEERKAKYPQDQAKSESDKQINDKIRDKLTIWFTHMYKGIALDTADGIVTVKGTVNRSDDIQRINDRIRKVEGVKNIDNQLTVK